LASTLAAAEAELLKRVEALSDSFDPQAVEEYVRLFSRVIAQQTGLWTARELEERYRRIRRPRCFRQTETIHTVFVLSRVTLGADIAVTSVLLDAARRRFPDARIRLVGGRKNHELFAGEPRIGWTPLDYGRTAPLAGRLAAGLALRDLLAEPGAIVLDPDSRLTQLGLLPVCSEDAYYFFESRTAGGEGPEPLAVLARRWVAETFGIPDAAPWLAPKGESAERPAITVSLGVGENPAKRVSDPFETELLAGLARLATPLLVDTGAGGEEAERVERAVRHAGLSSSQVRLFRGSFSEFALSTARSRLYVGYDSAGQHAAAALGVPVVTVFAGFPCERFFWRWQPWGPGPKATIRVDHGAEPHQVLERTLEAARRLLSDRPQVSSSGMTRTNSAIT